ncbi:hypothetical protein LIER_16793 [Lithospermum erythrorhizon]|uniref:Uncharacterized protein n=1 Tax=Lithospermum erythrorhizon TaxID=34254 RepID=A0AAV3Q806_LITER
MLRNPILVESYAIPNPKHCNLPAPALRVFADALVIVDVNGPAIHIGEYKRQQNTTDDQGTPFLFEHTKESENMRRCGVGCFEVGGYGVRIGCVREES